MIQRICKQCQETFYAKIGEVNRGRARYCSRHCRDLAVSSPLEERFKKYIGETTATGCILWNGPLTSTGYGLLALSRKDHKGVGAKGKFKHAHRVSWEISYGPIPESAHILHHCDTPPCINPEHLFLGNPAINAQDKVSKGRQIKGEDCNLSRLTEEAVREIRILYSTGKYAQKQLAEKFNTIVPNISAIVNRKSWKHLSIDPEDYIGLKLAKNPTAIIRRRYRRVNQ